MVRFFTLRFMPPILEVPDRMHQLAGVVGDKAIRSLTPSQSISLRPIDSSRTAEVTPPKPKDETAATRMTSFSDPWTCGLFHEMDLGVNQYFQWSPDFQARRLNLVVEGERP